MTARWRRVSEYALAAVDQHHHGIGGGGPSDHVAGVLHVARAVRKDKAALVGREVSVRDVDGDALLTLRSQAVGEEGEVEPARVREPTFG